MTCPWACSGLMYSGVPIVKPGWVRCGATAFLVAAEPEVRDLHPSLLGHQDVLGLDIAVDQPDLPGRTDGLAVCLMIENASGRSSAPFFTMYSLRFVPWTYSIAMKWISSTQPNV